MPLLSSDRETVNETKTSRVLGCQSEEKEVNLRAKTEAEVTGEDTVVALGSEQESVFAKDNFPCV
jgi:hypothetical protein